MKNGSCCDVQKQPPPLPVVDEATIKARAAAARAYALSSSPDFTTPSPLRPSLPPPPQPPPAAAAADEASQQQRVFVPHIRDEDYALFVKSLVDDEFFQSLPLDDEDFDFDFNVDLLADGDEEEDDDDDDDVDDDDEDDEDQQDQDSNDAYNAHGDETNQKSPAARSKSQQHDDDDDEPFTLQAELGLLLEEDIEAAITTLLSTSAPHPPSTPDKSSTSHTFNALASSATTTDDLPRTPLNRDGPASSSSSSTAPTKTTVTSVQMDRLQTMLQKHYQLLVQQAVLCVRSAQAPLHRTYVSESKEDLVEILDGAVGLLQDLDQVRCTDAIRHLLVCTRIGYREQFNTPYCFFNLTCHPPHSH